MRLWRMSVYRARRPQRPQRPQRVLAGTSLRVARPAGLRRPSSCLSRRVRPGRSWNWTAIASVIAALAAAAGVYFTGRSLDAARTQNAVAEQGQFTDRFTNAVDQLDRAGAHHLQARLGAIYALERLARDSPRDHPMIVEVLAAFIRTTTSKRAVADTVGPCFEQNVNPDVQAALTVLGRRNSTHDQTSRINLRGVCLHGADLSGADFAHADLGEVDLGDANLSGTNLGGADLGRANLGRVNGFEVYLAGADLSAACLSEAELGAADLSGAHLGVADLSSANLSKADLREAYLGGATLSRATLSLADLGAANLDSANLNDVYLIRSNLRYANLSEAKLGAADLGGADLEGADLRGAYLGGADLGGAEHDEDTKVSFAVINEFTAGVWW